MEEKEKKVQLVKISRQLFQINEILERILNAQFGIDDPEWINAIDKLEEGFGLAFNWVAKTNGIHVPTIYDNKDVERIVGEIMEKENKNDANQCIIRRLSDNEKHEKLSEKLSANPKEEYGRILANKERLKVILNEREKELKFWSKYVPAVRPFIYWLKDLISSSEDGIVQINLADFAKECGFKMRDLFNDDDIIDSDNLSDNLEEINPDELYNGFKFVLDREDIFVSIGPSKIDGKLVLNFENKYDHISNKYDDVFCIINVKVPKAFKGQKHFSREVCIVDYIQNYYINSDDQVHPSDWEMSTGIIWNGLDIADNKKEIGELLENFKNDKSWLGEAEDKAKDEEDEGYEGDLDFVDVFNIIEDA